VREHNDIMRPIEWDTPGSPRNLEDRKLSKAQESRRMTKVAYFEDSFAYKDDWETSAHEKVSKESPVFVELRTNVIVKDEFSLVTDLSAHIATRFQRSESAVMISIDHSACLMYGGSFEPAYIISVSALESQCQASTNKRNAALMQSFLADVLSVTPDRGVIRFNPIKEDCLATNGRTVAGQIEKIEGENGNAVKRVLAGNRKSGLGETLRRKSLFSSDRKKSTARDNRKSTVFASEDGRKDSIKPVVSAVRSHSSARSSTSSTPSMPTHMDVSVLPYSNKKAASTSKLNTTDQLLEEASRVLAQMGPPDSKNTQSVLPVPQNSSSRPASSRKSKANLSSTSLKSFPNVPLPPPIPAENEASPKVGRRKSFIAMFKRDTIKAV
jgi:hypothetical protein